MGPLSFDSFNLGMQYATNCDANVYQGIEYNLVFDIGLTNKFATYML